MAAVTRRARGRRCCSPWARTSCRSRWSASIPSTEPRTFRFVQHDRGRAAISQPGETGAVVVGQAIADRLSPDSTTRSWRRRSGQGGDIESALFRIVGIVRTGSEDIDATICQVALADVERLTGLAGAGEVTLVLDDWRRADAAKAALRRARRRAATT